MPRLIWGSTVPRKNQNSSCTRIGVPRNSPTYAVAAPRSSGFSDSRITAITVPRTTPTGIATTVSSSVTSRPCRIDRSKR